MRALILVFWVFSALKATSRQEQKATSDQEGMSNMSMPGHDVSNMKEMPGISNGSDDQGEADSAASAHAIAAMEHHHMNMGPHMKMTALREPEAGDQERAGKIAQIARQTAEKYQDYHVALQDGYKIFLPNVPQKQYHFTNNWYALQAAFGFHPEHPTSLLYQKNGDGYKLIGLMYTAPKRTSEDARRFLEDLAPMRYSATTSELPVICPQRERAEWLPADCTGMPHLGRQPMAVAQADSYLRCP